MSLIRESNPPAEPDTEKCLARSVADALAQNPSLEAVTINRARQTISVATLGQIDVPKLTERITATIRRVQETPASIPCTLLAGEGDCQTCDRPLSELEKGKITIRHDAEATTIARVTCPTAPKFWRWRDIPWPKVVPRDLGFLEHEIDEWKAQLLAALLCGLFGVCALMAPAGTLKVVGYLLAYLAGSWFTAQEVWERLRQRAIDGRF